MTWNPLWFQAYIDFEKPEAVHGIGEDAIFALGKGTVVMYDADKCPHEVHHVLYVPALRDLLIPKHWTRINGLTTTLDDEKMSFSLLSMVSPLRLPRSIVSLCSKDYSSRITVDVPPHPLNPQSFLPLLYVLSIMAWIEVDEPHKATACKARAEMTEDSMG